MNHVPHIPDQIKPRNLGYRGEDHDACYAVESWYWWFLTRNELIDWMLKQFAPQSGRYLEIGCGNGCVTRAVQDAFPNYDLHATEQLESGLINAKKDIPTANLFKLDARDLDAAKDYDVVCAFDVLEHIDADIRVITNVYRALKSGGVFVINVPQHKWLWSVEDIMSHHERRYTWEGLKSKLEGVGFEISYKTSFVSFLLPLMWLQRRFANILNIDNEDLNEKYDVFKISRRLNCVFRLVTQTEHGLRRLGVLLPFGGSLCVVAKKMK